MTQNILLVLTDEERAAGPYEGTGFSAARQQLRSQQRLAKTARHFCQHRISSSACVPSRASMLTGYSPWVHGVTQTDGMAKLADDQRMCWLPADGSPTVGHRFRRQGFETAYIGKWHLSHAALPGLEAAPAEAREAAYRSAQLLQPWGFSDWVGPEPHGPAVANCGLERDPGYVRQAARWLQEHSRRPTRQPFLLVVSLVNPHDIVFWPSWSMLARRRLGLEGIPPIGPAPTESQVLDSEPALITAYRRAYPQAYGPRPIVERLYRLQAETYRRFYASLLRRSDRHLGVLLDALEESGLAGETAVVFTSDHGELLGAHGGLHQKFYNAFEETLRVPLMIRDPQRAGLAGTSDSDPSEHRDLVPTLLSLAGLSSAHPGAPVLPGRDLLSGEAREQGYFVTLDHMLSGDSPNALVGRAFPALGAAWPMRYAPPPVRNHAVEALVWSEPGAGTRKVIRYFSPEHPGEHPDDEWQLFELDSDPVEACPLSSGDGLRQGQARLRDARPLSESLG